MSPSELDDALDAMHAASAGEPAKAPGLITVHTDDWIESLSGIRAACARLDDGLRYREVVVHIGAEQETRVLARGEANDRGAPYRDLKPRG